MRVSELWLREWVNPPVTSQSLAAQLTMAGLEVDSCYPVAGHFSGVIVAKVVETKPHPDADKLTLCQVKTNEQTYTVVCGAANVRAGLTVAFAPIGAELPGDFVIKAVKLRGQLSQGMLCSAAELGLEEHSEGIMELAADAPIGADLRAYLSLNDTVFDIDLTPNRADCFSVRGLAREIAAINELPYPADKACADEVTPQIETILPVNLSEVDACTRYCGRVIEGIDSSVPTPIWLSERLRRSGLRGIHPVVDVLNYVMLELGQPMHAFDSQAIEGKIEVRQSMPGESVELLDGQQLSLDGQAIVIADERQVLALAGIMGGITSAVHAETTTIFIESAYFTPLCLAGVARKYGLNTDAAQRFERGVDGALQRIALERATALLIAIVGGKPGPISEYACDSHQPATTTVSFQPEMVHRLTGVTIAPQQMMGILNRLGMTVHSHDVCWQIDVPSYRVDIHQAVDVVEEIIRLYGYENIAAQPIQTALHAGQQSELEQLSYRLAQGLSGRGYHETISYSFVDPAFQQALYPDVPALDLLNPISSELSQMRVSLWPGLLASMIYNRHRQQTAIKLFERGTLFKLSEQQTVIESQHMAGLLSGYVGALQWNEQERPFDFYDVKGDLETLFSSLHLCSLQWQADTHPTLHPGKCAALVKEGEKIGWVGALHPKLMDALDIEEEVILFELALEPLLIQSPVRFHPISKYPQIRRDLSLLVDKALSFAVIEQLIRQVVDARLLKDVSVFDIYSGDSIPENKKSVAVAIILQDDQATLVEDTINQIIRAILKKLKDQLAITLRDGS